MNSARKRGAFPAEYTIEVRDMRSITTLDLQYAHRFYGFKGEAQYLHGHTGVLTIEVEDSVEPGVNMVLSSPATRFRRPHGRF